MTRKKVLAVVLGLLMVVVGVCVGLAWSRSVAIGVWVQRNGLGSIGLDRVVIDTEAGGQVAFRPRFAPSGTKVVLIHGFGDQAGTWLGTARLLVDQMPLIVPDLAGHGESEPSTGTLSFDRLYGAFEEVLSELSGDGPIVLVGNSMGGWIAMRYALDHPGRVERLLLVNAAGLSQPLDERLLIPRDRAALSEKMGRMFPEGSIPRLPGFVQDQIIARTNSARFETLFRSSKSAELDERLPLLEATTHLVWGTPDGFFPLDYAVRLQEAIAGATLEELPGCGHAPQVVCPQQLGDWILATLGDSFASH